MRDPVAGCLQAQMVDVFFSNEKSTKDNYALKGVNINVSKGEIYALLGPGGCGKTTVLNSFTKRIKPSSGEVWISQNGSEANYGTGFGFMPQELSLFPELTIHETLILFSKINSVPSTELHKRIHQFSELLQLPPRNRQIGQISGGQQRRVSFVCALLRDAPLLILDEPTVGLDPILRQIIWTHLGELTSKMGKTVLLTTHYIEEAKDATTIGLMRDGQVLAETSPRELMKQFNEKSLEKCFYRICINSETAIPNQHLGCSENESLFVKRSRAIESKLPRYEPPTEANRRVSGMKKLYSRSSRTATNIGCLTIKNIKNLNRSFVMLFIQFVIPSIIVVLVRICIGESVTHLKAAIVNEEDPPYLSQQFLQELDTYSVVQKFYTTLEDGIDSVKTGENLVVVHFQPDFSYCLLHTTNLGIFSNNATVDCATVKLYMDTTNQVLSMSIYYYTLESFNRLKTTVLKMFDANPRIAAIPVQFVKPIYGSFNVKFRDFVAPAALLFVIYALQGLLTSVNLIMERQNGVFERLQLSKVSKGEIFAAQILASCYVVSVQTFLMLIVQFVVFTTDMKGSMFNAVVIIFLQGICGALFGFFLSSLTKSTNTGIIVVMGLVYPNIILGTCLWPLQGMSYVVRGISYMVPLSLSIESLRSIMYRGWTMSHQSVWLGIISLGGCSLFYLLVGILMYKVRK